MNSDPVVERMTLKKIFFTFICFLIMGGCTMKPDPGVAFQDVPFAVKPHIVKRGDYYYLRYQIAIEPGSLNLRRVLYSKRSDSKGYYYFSIPISHAEHGNVVERPLEDDQFTEFAKRKAVYWLNPDGSEIPLEIKEER